MKTIKFKKNLIKKFLGVFFYSDKLIRMKLKSKLKYYFYKSFPRYYIKFFNKAFDHKLNYNLLELIKRGLKIDVIFDIGAHKGNWSKTLYETSLKGKNFYLFEANDKNKDFLSKHKFKFFLEILSDKKKEVNFFSNNSTGDSYLVEQTSIYKKKIKPIIKNAITLDELVEREKLPFPDFIKIDTQGSEIDILKGSKKTISQCNLIYLECPILEYNFNAPHFHEYITFMSSIDYIPIDICELHKIDDVLIQIDILFLKKEDLKKIYPDKKILNILNSNLTI